MENVQNEKKMVGLGLMDTDKALDVMMEILPDVALIMNDKEAEDVLKKVKGKEAADMEAGDAYHALIPLFAKKYKPNFLRIVAACQGLTVDEVKKQNITVTVATFAASLRMMNGFFLCCLHMARNM